MIAKKRLQSGPGLLIGIPTLGRPVPLAWALALKSLNPPINYNTQFQIVQNQAVADARNQIAEHAVQIDAKYLFFLGDDVTVPAFTLKQLIYRMEHDEELAVVGGVYCAKTTPAAPLVFRDNGFGSYWDWKIGEYFEVSGLGMDCTLIRVEALKHLERPLFKTVDEDKFLDGINEAVSWTEDLWFLDKLRKANVGKIYCDASVICGHWDVYSNAEYKLPKGSLPMRMKGVELTKKALLINLDEREVEGHSVTTFGDAESSDYRGKVNSLPFAPEEFDMVAVGCVSWVALSVSIREWFRCLKVGGLLSVEIDQYTRRDSVTDWLKDRGYDVTDNGSFLDIRSAARVQEAAS